MDRSKRAIKTPKRFDDEAFETPPKAHSQAVKHFATDASIKTPELTPTTAKNIIKVKLTTKIKPREPIKPIEIAKPPKPEPQQVSVDQSKDVAATAEQSPEEQTEPNEQPAKPEELTGPKEPTKLKEPAKPKETPIKTNKEKSEKPHSESVTKQPKESGTIKEPNSVRQPKEAPKPKDLVKLKEPTKAVEIKTLEREPQLVYRPKTKRPRTPPIYADLIPNVVLPFWDARTAAEDHEDDDVKELVHCHCGVVEELGLMVQCETCLTWQHAHCLGIERAEEAPDGYTCRACSDPKFARESMKLAYYQEWLTKGKMKQFPCDPNPIPEKNVSILRQINQLIANVLNIHQIIHSLRIKNRILMNASDDDPELKLFRVQWPASYQHRDGSHFIPTNNNPSSSPASTISAIVETPDLGDITVETAADATLPDIGQLEDITAILENPFVSNQQPAQQQQQITATNNEQVTPDDCRANLRLHIQQTEEFIGNELSQIEEQVANLEKECSLIKNGENLETSLDSLKNDLLTLKRYIALSKNCENRYVRVVVENNVPMNEIRLEQDEKESFN